ncbi:MAG: MarR family transcriptional regulator [Anaerolineae bacterium]|nr:MarR family transcriptional regulator [Anaerolineae bacterium]
MADTKQHWFEDKEKRERWINFVQTLNPDIDPQATRLMDEFNAVSKMIHNVGQTSVDTAGLSLAQYRILMQLLFAEQIGGKECLNPSEISERQGTSRNTVSALIRSLEEDGLIERSLDPHDRRKFNIQLTENGRSLVTNHARQHFQTIGHCFSTLSPDEQTTLSNLLTKLKTQAQLTVNG